MSNHAKDFSDDMANFFLNSCDTVFRKFQRLCGTNKLHDILSINVFLKTFIKTKHGSLCFKVLSDPVFKASLA